MIVCALALPALAPAETFLVNSNGDATDQTPGDEFCVTESGKCTLRAAIVESNALGGFNVVEFEEEDLFDGNPATATITPATPLPPITVGLYIHGLQCTRESGLVGPCVGIVGLPGTSALTVEGAPETEIEWLSITGAETGIEVLGSSRVKVFASWLGVGLDGSPGPNGTGVFYGPGSNNARVGQPGEARGNLFANNTEVGLDLLGVSEARVLGNRFGVAPDGSTPAPNGEDIEVTSDTTGPTEAAGNEIGERVDAGGAGGPCDGACNLISGAAENGLDLEGDGGDEGPAVATSVVGNYFGLDVAGAAAVPNALAGIRVGTAPQTVIGGPKAGDANRFAGGEAGVDAGPAAPDLVIRGNLVGIGGAGGPVVSPDVGLDVDSEGLPEPALEALIDGNELRMDGGSAIAQQGSGGWIAHNRISGAEVGIETFGSVGSEGNLIEGNTIADSGLAAILLENELNEVIGNRVAGAGVAGIAVLGEAPSGVSGNVIGGDVPAEENEISGSAGAAIEIVNTNASMTTVAANHGAANAGLFIDLVPAAGEVQGPNGNIAPPAIVAATPTGVSGTGEAGATVRVFRKLTAGAGEIEALVGVATVDIEGNWSLLYGAALPPGTPIAAGQTSEAGGSSELALSQAGSGGSSGGGSGGGSGSGSGADSVPVASAPARGDKTPPRTAILGMSRAHVASTTVRFRFASDETKTKFQCRLDRGRFRSCRSPQRFSGLRPGKHVFAVRAVDAAGNADKSPAKRKFEVLASR